MPPGSIALYTVYDDKLNFMIDSYSHMQSLTTMDHFMLNTPFDFVKEPAEIFKALLESKEQATAIGIKSEMLGKGMFVTGVKDILIGDGHENTLVILKGYDFTGHILSTSNLRLTEIEGVCQFSSKFGNPILKTLSKILKI